MKKERIGKKVLSVIVAVSFGVSNLTYASPIGRIDAETLRPTSTAANTPAAANLIGDLSRSPEEPVTPKASAAGSVLQQVQDKLLAFESKLPTYVTLRPVIEDVDGRGNRYTMPVAQFEKFWGDTTMFLPTQFVVVGDDRSVHLKVMADKDRAERRGLRRDLLPLLPKSIMGEEKPAEPIAALPYKAGRAKEVITSNDESVRNISEEELFSGLSASELLEEAKSLEGLRRDATVNFYQKVRACSLLYVLYRFYLFDRKEDWIKEEGAIDFDIVVDLGNRRFEDALTKLFAKQQSEGYSKTIFSYIAAAYNSLMFEYLKKQVERAIQALPENTWMFKGDLTLEEYQQKVHQKSKELLDKLLAKDAATGLYPILHVAAPIRIELTSNVASDIFFLAMDRPERARAINISANLAVQGTDDKPVPPINIYMRVIDKPVIRLRSVDLKDGKDVDTLAELFNFRNDQLSALKAAVIASGLIPFGFEKRKDLKLEDILEALLGRKGVGFEFVTDVNAKTKPIPRGSGLAVSTMLLVAGIDAGMLFSGQTKVDEQGNLSDQDKRMGSVRTVFGEWLGGSGGGWQDSGGQWPGIKSCEGRPAQPGDVEFGTSKGKLMPEYIPFQSTDPNAPYYASEETLGKLMSSMVLVHGGACQDVGPVLQNVSIAYLLRTKAAWDARLRSEAISDQQIANLKKGDIQSLGTLEDQDWDERITIVPLADNAYIYEVNRRLREKFGKDFWGFDSTGCRGGAGGVYLVNPARRDEFIKAWQRISNQVRKEMGKVFPIEVEPTCYKVEVNKHGIQAFVLTGDKAVIPEAARPTKKMVAERKALPPDAQQTIQSSAASNMQKLTAYNDGKIGLRQNRKFVKSMAPASREELVTLTGDTQAKALGEAALRNSEVMVVTLAEGVGARFTGGEVAKPGYPVLKIGDRWYSFMEIHAQETRAASRKYKVPIPHLATVGSVTGPAITELAKRRKNFGLGDNFSLVPASVLSQRAYPTAADLDYVRGNEAKLPDARQEELRDQLLATEKKWADEGRQRNPQGFKPDGAFTSPLAQFNPPGHFYWLWYMILSGKLGNELWKNPKLKYIFQHNIDNLVASVDSPEILGRHIQSGKPITSEVAAITAENVGGGAANVELVDGRKVQSIVEAPAAPTEADEFKPKFYNVASYWLDIDKVLAEIGLTREQVIALAEELKTKPAEVTVKAASAGRRAVSAEAVQAAVYESSTLIVGFVDKVASQPEQPSLADFKEALSRSLKQLETLRSKGSAEQAAPITAAIQNVTLSLDMVSRTQNIAAEHTKLQAVSGTIIINDAEIPANQSILLSMLDKDNPHVAKLEEKLGAKIRLLSQFDAAADSSDNMIAVSKARIDTIPNLKYINIDTKVDGAYLPIEQVIVLAKGLLVYNKDKSPATISAISQIYKLLTNGQPMGDNLLEDFAAKGLFILALPVPTPIDPATYDMLHRQALAILIAA